MSDNDIQPFKITAADRAVGLLIVVTLALVALFYVLRSQQFGPVDTSAHFHTTLTQSYGIVRGSDITLSGLPIGQIRSIELVGSEGVRVEFFINKQYRQYVTHGSYLQVGSSLGISSLIGGATLNFVPSPTPGTVIVPGEFVDSREPQNLDEAFGDLELKKMATDVKVLLRNLREVSEVVHENQASFSDSMRNIEALTGQLSEVVKAIPRVAESAEQGFDEWGRAGTSIQAVVSDSGEDIRQIARHTRAASAELQTSLQQLNDLLSHLNQLAVSMQSSAQRLPTILNDTHQLIRGANTVTERLESHWLFGGGAPPALPRLPLTSPSPEP